jgi:diketogulonate reductase-like aldo/keto reductase
MQTRRFGPLAHEVSVIGLGTWNMERDDASSAREAIARAVDIGMVHIDTAELYGTGRVETLVGEALVGKRDRVFLVSKVLPRNATHAGTLRACEASLQRLRTDHLDLYLLHWREDLPLEPTFKAFEELRAAGKIRAWGVSNFDDEDLAEALAIVGPGKIACDQVLYHLGAREIEHRVVPWCEQHDVAVVAYSPFGSAGGFPRSRDLVALAERLGCTPRQLALAFLTRRQAVFAIPKSSLASHVDELAGAAEVTLDAATIASLEAMFPLAPWQGLPML